MGLTSKTEVMEENKPQNGTNIKRNTLWPRWLQRLNWYRCKSASTQTFIAEETLPSVGAKTRRFELRLGNAGGAACTRVSLAGGELAQLTGVERRTHTEPVLRITTHKEPKWGEKKQRSLVHQWNVPVLHHYLRWSLRIKHALGRGSGGVKNVKKAGENTNENTERNGWKSYITGLNSRPSLSARPTSTDLAVQAQVKVHFVKKYFTNTEMNSNWFGIWLKWCSLVNED